MRCDFIVTNYIFVTPLIKNIYNGTRMAMKRLLLLALSASITFIFINSCEMNGLGDDEPFTINGVVEDIDNDNSLDEALVEIILPEDLNQTATTNTTGQYVFEEVFVDSVVDIRIEASKEGYTTASIDVVAVPGRDINVPPIKLRDTRVPSDDGDSGPVGGPSAGVAAIILTGVTNETINIAETGGTVNTAFTYALQDSAGRNISTNNAVDVEFSILTGPGGGEGITPEVVRSNSSGTVTSNLFAGNTAGVVQIQALVEREDIGLTILSKPVAITIHGGFPDLDHFSIAPESYNFEGYNINNNRNPLTVILGDEFSNPVKPGTAVYFSTTGGVIEGSGQGHTNEDGEVTVDLISGDPRPTDTETLNGVNFGGRPGLSTVTARTINGDSQFIEKQINVVFSTSEAIISATPTTFDLDPNGGASFDYTVTDLNGNPMAAGTNIVIDGGEGIEVTGDADFTLGNHIVPGPGATEFRFSIRDTDDETNDPADLTISIEVTSPEGNTTTYSGIQGVRRKAPSN